MKWLLFILMALPARAGELEDLRQEVQKLRAQVPADADALHALENRVEALSQEVQRLAAAREAEPFVQKAIDELRDEVHHLGQRLAATQQRLAEPLEPAVRVGYDEGAYLQTGPVRVQLNLQLMPRWIGTLRIGRANSSDFELHHGQLQVRGEILGWLALQLMLDFGAEFLLTQHFLRDAFIDVHATSWLTLRAGQFKVPFSHQRLVSSFRQTFTDRTVATRAFSLDRDLGGEAELAFLDERVLVQLAVTNGQDAPRNDNVDFAYTLRVVGQPLGRMPLTEGDLARGPARFSIGAAFQYNLVPNDQGADLDQDGAVDNVAVYSLGGEAAVKWRGFALEAEYYMRIEQPGAGQLRHLYQGAYLQLSAMVWRGLELAARASYAQPHVLGGAHLGILGDQPRSVWEAGGVVNYFVWRDKVRGQIAYDFRQDQLHAVAQGHVVQVQIQAGF
jgi:hypothetical protein